jgi:hypothetical protein
MKSHSGEAKETESNAVANNVAQKKSAEPVQSKLQEMVNASPQVQQLKAYQLMADSCSPSNQLPVQLAKLPNLARPHHYIEPKEYANVGFTADHRVDPTSKFTITEATTKAAGKTTNTILEMGDTELHTELKHILPQLDNDVYMTNGKLFGTTSKAYPWITRRKPAKAGDPLRFEGGTSILKLGLLKKGEGPKLRFNHLYDDNLVNDPTWIAAKKATDAAAEAEAARLAAEEEAARVAAAQAAAEEEPAVAGAPDEAEKRRIKNRKKKAKQKAKKKAETDGDEEEED